MGHQLQRRSLVYADDLLLTALIGNDNSMARRAGVSSRLKKSARRLPLRALFGGHPGNSMGGVPDHDACPKLEMTAKQTESIQTFNQWGTSRTYLTNIIGPMGDRVGNLSWFLAGNISSNRTQPLTYVTTPTTGGSSPEKFRRSPRWARSVPSARSPTYWALPASSIRCRATPS